MPFAGLGLHFLIAIFFAVHAVRNGQQLYWLIILFSFPLLGSAVYFFVIYLPSSRLQHGARKVVSVATKTLDPGRELREAQAAFDYTPTAQNQMRLASALLEAGQAAEAAKNYEACLKGPFASDPEMRLSAARAFLACERANDALLHLEAVRATDANFRAEQISILYAQALAMAQRMPEAQAAYQAALARFGSFEVRAEYAIWAANNGHTALAQQLNKELQETVKHWNKHSRQMNSALLRRVSQSLSSLG